MRLVKGERIYRAKNRHNRGVKSGGLAAAFAVAAVGVVVATDGLAVEWGPAAQAFVGSSLASIGFAVDSFDSFRKKWGHEKGERDGRYNQNFIIDKENLNIGMQRW